MDEDSQKKVLAYLEDSGAGLIQAKLNRYLIQAANHKKTMEAQGLIADERENQAANEDIVNQRRRVQENTQAVKNEIKKLIAIKKVLDFLRKNKWNESVLNEEQIGAIKDGLADDAVVADLRKTAPHMVPDLQDIIARYYRDKSGTTIGKTPSPDPS